jgi:poly-gamma-glutamate capsule biosynthesis protein CapA/YwtB (metallophosphatase superfamily)
MLMKGEEAIVYAVGDIFPDRPEPESIFEHVANILRGGDIAFCSLESPLTHTTAPPFNNATTKRDPDRMAAALKKAGFKVVSFATNHCLQDGTDAFLETIQHLRNKGLFVIGVGKDIEEARQSALVDCKGTRIAFLGYNSVARHDYWAQARRPGCAPLRTWTLYESMHPDQPGTPPWIHTFLYREDLDAMKADVSKARAHADIVIASVHCGVGMVPSMIADYQVDAAHAAIDAGAELLLQHHAHILKGIEVYRGKVIFYGLGNFAIEIHFMTKEWSDLPEIKKMRKMLNPEWNPPYPEYPSFPFPPDSRKTIIVKCIIADKNIKSVSFLPAIINRESQPEALQPNDSRFQEVVRYVEMVTKEAGFDTKFNVDGEEVKIEV